MSNPNITKQQLKEELENGKTYKEIAYDHGYGYPSRALSRKIKDLGYEKNNQFSFYKSGGVNLSIKPEKTMEALKKKDLLDEEGERPGSVYYTYEVKESGDILVKPTIEEWSKKQ